MAAELVVWRLRPQNTPLSLAVKLPPFKILVYRSFQIRKVIMDCQSFTCYQVWKVKNYANIMIFYITRNHFYAPPESHVCIYPTLSKHLSASVLHDEGVVRLTGDNVLSFVMMKGLEVELVRSCNSGVIGLRYKILTGDGHSSPKTNRQIPTLSAHRVCGLKLPIAFTSNHQMPPKRSKFNANFEMVGELSDAITASCIEENPQCNIHGIRPLITMMYLNRSFANAASIAIDVRIANLVKAFRDWDTAVRNLPTNDSKHYAAMKEACSDLRVIFHMEIRLCLGNQFADFDGAVDTQQVSYTQGVNTDNWRNLIIHLLLNGCMLCDGPCEHDRSRMGIHFFGRTIVAAKKRCFDQNCIYVETPHRFSTILRPHDDRYSANLLGRAILSAAGHLPIATSVVNAAAIPALRTLTKTSIGLLPCKEIPPAYCLATRLGLSDKAKAYAMSIFKSTFNMDLEEAQAARAYRVQKYTTEVQSAINFYGSDNIYKTLIETYDKFELFLLNFMDSTIPLGDLSSRHQKTRLTFAMSFQSVQHMVAETILLAKQLPTADGQIFPVRASGDAYSYLFQHDLAFMPTDGDHCIETEFGRGKFFIDSVDLRVMFERREMKVEFVEQIVGLAHIFDALEMATFNFKGTFNLVEMEIRHPHCPVALMTLIVPYEAVKAYHNALLCQARDKYEYLKSVPIPVDVPKSGDSPNEAYLSFLEQLMGSCTPFPELRGLALRAVGLSPRHFEVLIDKAMVVWRAIDADSAPISLVGMGRALLGLSYETRISTVDHSNAVSRSKSDLSSDEEAGVEYAFP